MGIDWQLQNLSRTQPMPTEYLLRVKSGSPALGNECLFNPRKQTWISALKMSFPTAPYEALAFRWSMALARCKLEQRCGRAFAGVPALLTNQPPN